MLIFGWKVRRKTRDEGVFFSPAAGGDAPYRLIEARRWFSLFFIPLIPLAVIGTYVECQTTKATYDPAILSNPTTAEFRVQLAAAIREVVAAVALADGTVSDQERRLAVQVVRGYVPDYDSAAFADDLARAGQSPLDARLDYLATTLNEQGREQLLTAAATVMAADGVIDDRDREVVTSIGRRLTMSPAHVRGVIDTAAAISESRNV
jgi:tellurite resistance protein